MYKERKLTPEQMRVSRLIKRAAEDYICDAVMTKTEALSRHGLKNHGNNRMKFENELSIQMRPIFGEDLRKGKIRFNG